MTNTTARVLVIEDSPQLADSLRDLLNLRQIDVSIALNGREGVAQAAEQLPDLILLDIRLPDIDGYEVYRQIKMADWGRELDIIILTASESIDEVAKNLALRSSDVLFKPDWSMRELLTYITDRLQLNEQTTAVR